jgi:hypothetical protein
MQGFEYGMGMGWSRVRRMGARMQRAAYEMMRGECSRCAKSHTWGIDHSPGPWFSCVMVDAKEMVMVFVVFVDSKAEADLHVRDLRKMGCEPKVKTFESEAAFYDKQLAKRGY